MARWKMLDVVAAMRGELTPVSGAADCPEWFEGIAFDSRRVAEGELFFALAGEQTDGHRFVAGALAAGAAAAVVERFPDPLKTAKGCLILVPDSFAALHDLTRWVREQTPENLVGITGSAGKTTTKQMLAAMLTCRFRVAASPGNLNNLYGFPMSLLGIPRDTEWMVAEMGMSTPGELGGVSELGRPDVAVFTNVRLVHLEAFDRSDRPATLSDIGDAKAELLRGLRSDGLVVANADDAEVRRIVLRHLDANEDTRVSWYSVESVEEPVRLELASEVESAPEGIVFDVACDGEASVTVRLPLHGAVNAQNFLAAATCALELGVGLEEIVQAVANLDLGSGRGHLLALRSGAVVVDDTYNSNPDALRHAVKAALAMPAERHWAVVGEMRELGLSSAVLHRETGEWLARERGLEHVIAVGEEARPLAHALDSADRSVVWVPSAAAAADLVEAELRSGDLLLIKGSRGVGLEVVVERLVALDSGESGEQN